jgi:hypothetical protein
MTLIRAWRILPSSLVESLGNGLDSSASSVKHFEPVPLFSSRGIGQALRTCHPVFPCNHDEPVTLYWTLFELDELRLVAVRREVVGRRLGGVGKQGGSQRDCQRDRRRSHRDLTPVRQLESQERGNAVMGWPRAGRGHAYGGGYDQPSSTTRSPMSLARCWVLLR